MSAPLLHLTVGVVSLLLLIVASRFAAHRYGAGEDSHSLNDPSTRWIGKERVQLIAIVDEAQDIKTFTVQRADGKAFPPFRAGQFLSFQIGEDSKQVRSYSIASSADQSQTRVDVAIKRLEGGFGSQWFHERKVGEWLWAYGPSGRFTDVSAGQELRVFIAGGIGITPILSMIRTRIARNAPGRMVLIYGVRSPNDLAFDSVLRELASNKMQLTYVPLFSEAPPRQRITLDIVRQYVANLADARFFICGPTAMNDSITGDLLAAGVREDLIHDEKFVSKTMLDPALLREREAIVRVSTQSYLYAGRESLLDFLEGHGVNVASACRSGVCGSCKCVVRGEYEALTDTGLSRVEKQLGYTLTCVTYPKNGSQLEVVLPGTV